MNASFLSVEPFTFFLRVCFFFFDLCCCVQLFFRSARNNTCTSHRNIGEQRALQHTKHANGQIPEQHTNNQKNKKQRRAANTNLNHRGTTQHLFYLRNYLHEDNTHKKTYTSTNTHTYAIYILYINDIYVLIKQTSPQQKKNAIFTSSLI